MAEIEGRIHDSGNLVGEIFGGSSTPPVIQPKTITENGTYPAPSGVDGFSPVTVNVPGIVPTGTKNITQNGDHDVTQYAVAHVNVPSPQINLQDKTVTENGDVTADEGYDGLGTVTVNVQSAEPTYQEKSVTAPASGTTAVTPDSGYDGLSKVTVSPTPTETKSINANGTYTPSSGKHIGTVIVNVPSDTPETQEKTVSPSTSQQIVEPDSGKLLSKVTVSAIQTETKSATPSESAQQITPTSGKFLTRVDVDAIPSGYVGSDVPRKSSADLTASGATVNVPAGYYSTQASKAIASGTAGTPTATKGAVSNHQISVTPSVENAAGYIGGGTKTGTPVTVSASELTSGSETKQQNGTYDVTNLRQIVVNVPSTEPVIQPKNITQNGTYTAPSGVDGYNPITVNVSGGGTTYDYVRQQKSITDPYGLFTMKSLAKPEHVEVKITSESLPDWSLDAVVDFPTGTNLVTVEVQDESTGTLKLIASRSDYGFACDVLYKYTGYDYEWWVWDDNTKSDAAIVDATVYSNSAVYEGFTPVDGFWHTDGKRILDENGGQVLINGIGMMANTYNGSTFSIQESPRIQEISNASIAEIASVGFNTIRLNFGYQLFEDDDNPGVYKQAGWDWFDQIASWAAANNVKVIPTLHCPQGGIQSTVDGYDLWAVQANQDRLVAMWTAIANRYKNNTAIIGYGIVNELHLKLYDQSEASTFSAFSNLFQRIINAIRTVDTNHMIFAERGLRFYSDNDFKTFWNNPSATGSEFSPDDAYIFYPTLADSNLVVEYHEYYGSPRALGTHRQPLAKMEQHLDDTIVLFDRINGNDAPLFIGEYGCNWNYDGDVLGSEDYERLSWTRDAHEMYVRRGLAHDLHTYFGWDKSTQSPPSYLNSMGLRRSTRYLNPKAEDDVTNNANATLYQPIADIFNESPEIILQNKTITENGSYTADEGYDGLGVVTVNVSGGGLPDVILPGSTPVKMSSNLGGGTNSTTDVAVGSSLTILKAGTYRIRCSIFRSSNATSATWKLYLAKNGTRITSESPTWDTTTRRTAEIVQDVTCAAGDVLQMRGSVSSNSYYIFCSPIVACIDWNLGV